MLWERTIKIALPASAALSLLTASAFAADIGPEMPVKGPPLPAPFTWSGCYAGVAASGGIGQTGISDTHRLRAPGLSDTFDISGYTLGGQIGCDYQFAANQFAPNWVLGIEGGAAGGNVGGTTTFSLTGLPGDTATFKENTDLLTSITGRVGYAWDRWLLYAKGGAAWAGNRYTALDTIPIYNFQGSETRFGWTAGGGIEWAVWNDWSLRLEYDYYGFGTKSITFINTINSNTGPENISQNIQVIKLGVNFHVPASAAPFVPLDW